MIGIFIVLMEDFMEDELSQVSLASSNIELLLLEGCGSAVCKYFGFPLCDGK